MKNKFSIDKDDKDGMEFSKLVRKFTDDLIHKIKEITPKADHNEIEVLVIAKRPKPFVPKSPEGLVLSQFSVCPRGLHPEEAIQVINQLRESKNEKE